MSLACTLALRRFSRELRVNLVTKEHTTLAPLLFFRTLNKSRGATSSCAIDFFSGLFKIFGLDLGVKRQASQVPYHGPYQEPLK